jgi:hypothetical protein
MKNTGANILKSIAKPVLFSTIILFSQGLQATGDDRIKSIRSDESCNLGLDIPERLSTISKSKKEIVFRDKSRKAVLIFTKVGLADYDFDLESNAHKVYAEMEKDPTALAVNIKRKDLSVTECFILDWENNDTGPNRKNDYSRMALIEICGQYYNFTFSLPSSKKAEILPLFSQILESVDKVAEEK